MSPEQVGSLVGAAQGLLRRGQGAICRGVRVEALQGSSCHQPVRKGGGGEGVGKGSGSKVGMVREEDGRVFS